MSKNFRLTYNSPVILTFSFISIASLAAGYITNFESTFLLFSVYRSSALDPLFYIRLVCHVFGHASFEHFINNFIIIFLIGPMLEERYGSKKLALFMLFVALVTGIANIIFFDTALLGASGIVFMLIILSSYVNIKRGAIPLTLILVAAAYLGKEIISSFLQTDNVSHLTHILGGVLGIVFGTKYNNK